jgi:hypothetical protein
MVSVYDDNSLLSGLIDPNSEVFAYYNVDKPVEVVNGVDPSGNVVHRGQSVYTLGNVIADGSIISAGPLYSSALTTIIFSNVLTNSQILIDTNKGNTFICNIGSLTLLSIIYINTIVAPPAGVTVTLFITTGTIGGTFTFAGTAALGRVATIMATSANVASNKTYVYSFVSNGSNLVNTSVVVY